MARQFDAHVKALRKKLAPDLVVIKASRAKHWNTGGLKVAIHAGTWAELVAEVVAEHVDESVREAKSPSGTAMPPLKGSRLKQAQAGRRSAARGVTREERFIRSIGVETHSGDVKRGSATVTTTQGFFAGFLRREEKRGAEYFAAHGEVAQLVEAAFDALMSGSIK